MNVHHLRSQHKYLSIMHSLQVTEVDIKYDAYAAVCNTNRRDASADPEQDAVQCHRFDYEYIGIWRWFSSYRDSQQLHITILFIPYTRMQQLGAVCKKTPMKVQDHSVADNSTTWLSNTLLCCLHHTGS